MLTRRELMAASAAVLASSREALASEAGLVALPDKKPLIARSFRPPNFETPLADLRQPFTRNDAFFVRYHLPVIPEIDTSDWTLAIAGPGTERELTLSLRDLRRDFERVAIPAVNQCSGNRRGLFVPRVPGVQWEHGAMGHALWGGVRLADVLRRAGVRPDAVEVVFECADAGVLPQTPVYVKSLPIERALAESTLIAFEMNGKPLPHLHGAPARLVVPGWTATYWMKHLRTIRVVQQPFDGFWMKNAYRLPLGAFPGARFPSQDDASTTPITEILVNSIITSPAEGNRLRRSKPAEVRGWAWDGGSGIAAVDISVDRGQSWQPAKLDAEIGPFAWRGFRFRLDTRTAGTLEVMARATGRNGQRQPQALTVNAAGYHHNVPQVVKVEVA